MTSWHENAFHITGSLWWRSYGHRWFPSERASNVAIYFFMLVCTNSPVAGNWRSCDVTVHYSTPLTDQQLLVLCAGNSPVASEFPAQRPVTQSFDIFFDLHLDERLSKQS